jgi:hypothetical protein
MNFFKKIIKKIKTWNKHRKFDKKIKKMKRKNHFIYK